MSTNRRATVVMVDDDTEDVFVIRKALSRNLSYITFDAVDSGAQLLEILSDPNVGHPDLVLLDINMPKMTGYDVLDHLQHEQRLENLTVVMLTTSTSDADRKKSLELGASDFLSKPHSRRDMHEFIHRLEQLIPHNKVTA